MSAGAQSSWKPPDADRQPSAWTPPESDRTPPAEASPIAKAGQAFFEGIGGQAALDIIRMSNRYGTPQEVAARGERGMTALKGIVQGIAGEPARVWDELSRTGQAMIDPKQTTADVAYHMAGAVPFLGAPAQQVAIDLQRGDPAAAVGHTGALVAPFLVGPAAEATGRGIAATGRGITSATGAAVDVVGGTSPAMREAVGVISPRAKHVLDVAARVKKARDAYLTTQAAETTGTPSAAKTSVTPAAAPVTGATDDALLQLYSVETNPAKRAALKTELIDRGLMNPPGTVATPPEANPYRSYSQDALRKVYAIEPEAAKRALIEQAARNRGLSLLTREGRRATAAVPETGEAAEARGPSLTQDEALILRFLGTTDPLSASAADIATARQLAVDNPELLRRLRAGEPEPVVAQPTPAEKAMIAQPAVQSVPAAMEYNAPGITPPQERIVRGARQAGKFTPEEQARAAAILENVEPTTPPAAPPAAAPKPAAAELAQQFEATTRPDRMLDFLKRMDPEISPAAIDNLDPNQWELVARGAGSPAGTIPTPEDIAAVRGNLAQSEGASQITAKTPSEAVTQFEQNRDIRTKRKGPATAPTPATDLETQLADSLAGKRTAPPPEGPRALTAAEERVEAYAQHFAPDTENITSKTLEDLPKSTNALLQLEALGKRLGIKGRPASLDEVQQIVDRVRQLRGEKAGPVEADYATLYPRAGTHVDGLKVRGGVPNMDSIKATLGEDYEELPGVREVPLDAFGVEDNHWGKRPYGFYDAKDADRVEALSHQIKDSGEISPLIVVIDKEGPYILEGSHRVSALARNGHTKIPAKVVIDTSESAGIPTTALRKAQ